MKLIKEDSELTLQVIATGMHFASEFGTTYENIEKDGFDIDHKLEMLLRSDSGSGISKSVGLGVIGMTDALSDLEPDLIVILGDRFEILAAATAALFTRIPVLHIHGGELTEGSVDDSIRHAITKMAHVHCVASEVYLQRVIQLGEMPERVHCVGGLGVDVLKKTMLIERPELEGILDFKFKKKNLLVTFHPVTTDTQLGRIQMRELLGALEDFNDTGLIFTSPNADAGGRELSVMINSFVANHPNARTYASLGQDTYLSCMAQCDGVIGNSSSGLLEAPTFNKGTINIGNRQAGRLRALSVIDCIPSRNEIKHALERLYSPEFQLSLSEILNPYGNGGASERVVHIIKNLELDQLTLKTFYDLPIASGSPSGFIS
jgi:GDP/UDP-N,N'-diacetylbacillosamine 2-epimerase (hydrolysing)